ncbi:DUF2288 domain-containing protein [Gynuella sp.]|uniref:DUF2288 domain-containing protein n=1 Tax=Gynuella sp. TaxID=2969146 RepID=UPI003D0A8626
MTENEPTTHDLDIAVLNREAAKISWRELQVFFASGKTIYVSPDLDLLEVAVALKRDDADKVRHWQSEGMVGVVTDEQALEWYQADSLLWSVVIKPFVLVQDKV